MRKTSPREFISSGEAGTHPAHRYGMVTGIKPEKIDHYKQLHANPWPGVLEKIKECNIRNYSIFIREIDNNYYLFSYFEYTGDNFEGDMEKMAADTLTRRWWNETSPTQIPLPDTVAVNGKWSSMEEVFHLE
ncbi:MAG TPA: L-rhamnose mutarotase [Anseongella sp.]